MYNVFIDGAEGTTGLKIHEYFKKRDDINIIRIDEAKRKDLDERLAMIKKADISFLCLPDAASSEIAAAAPAECRILDTSTAHRTNDDWVYGMPELSKGQRQKIKESNRVAVPGCHATGAILIIRPLLEAGYINADYPFSVFSLTGYSGGGKKMIADYESCRQVRSPGQYAITQKHKHLPEIMKATGLETRPSFMPVVGHFFSGMEVTVPLSGGFLKREISSVKELTDMYREYYEGNPMVSIKDTTGDNGFIYSDRLAGSNRLEISVEGSEENPLIVATYDNLGKGASGAAVQNMNIMLGIDETKGLI